MVILCLWWNKICVLILVSAWMIEVDSLTLLGWVRFLNMRWLPQSIVTSLSWEVVCVIMTLWNGLLYISWSWSLSTLLSVWMRSQIKVRSEESIRTSRLTSKCVAHMLFLYASHHFQFRPSFKFLLSIFLLSTPDLVIKCELLKVWNTLLQCIASFQVLYLLSQWRYVSRPSLIHWLLHASFLNVFNLIADISVLRWRQRNHIGRALVSIRLHWTVLFWSDSSLRISDPMWGLTAARYHLLLLPLGRRVMVRLDLLSFIQHFRLVTIQLLVGRLWNHLFVIEWTGVHRTFLGKRWVDLLNILHRGASLD